MNFALHVSVGDCTLGQLRSKEHLLGAYSSLRILTYILAAYVTFFNPASQQYHVCIVMKGNTFLTICKLQFPSFIK